MSRRILAADGRSAGARGGCTGCSTTKKEDKPIPLVKIHAQFVPKRVWSATVGETEPKLQLGLAPAIDGTRVYGANAEGDVVALDLANGHRLWRHKLKMPLSGGTGAGGGLVLVCATGGMRDCAGRKRWQRALACPTQFRSARRAGGRRRIWSWCARSMASSMPWRRPSGKQRWVG